MGKELAPTCDALAAGTHGLCFLVMKQVHAPVTVLSRSPAATPAIT